MSAESSLRVDSERSPSISSMSTSENLIANYVEYLFHFNYEKAKTIIEKHREYKENLKLWNSFQNALIQLVYTEKLYNNIQFLNQKSSTKDKYYETVVYNLEQIMKDGNTSSTAAKTPSQQQTLLATSLDISNFLELITQLLQFADFRSTMINIYSTLKEKEVFEKPNNLINLLLSIGTVEEKYKKIFVHPLLDPLRSSLNLELSLIKNLLECHIALSINFNCIRAVVNIKTINDYFNKQVPQMNAKQTKESKSFFFNRSSPQQKQLPVLYQWFKIYYQFLLNKFSLFMCNPMSQVAPSAKVNEIDHIMSDKIDLYTKIANYVKKNNIYLFSIVYEIDNSLNNDFRNYSFTGDGYQLKDQSALNELCLTDRYPFMFCYPKRPNQINNKHLGQIITLITLMSSDAESKVRYHFDDTLKSSYYASKIQDHWTMCIICELNKQENKNKTASFMQEICSELNLNRAFQLFNTNLK